MAKQNKTVEATVLSIRRATRKKYTAEELEREIALFVDFYNNQRATMSHWIISHR